MLMNIAPVAVLSWAGVLVNLAAVIIRCVQGADLLTVTVSVGQSLVNLCLTVLLLGLITTISEWRNIRCTTGQKLLAIVTFPVFMLTYLPVTVAALVCKPGWKPIAHHKNVPVQELTCPAEERGI